MESQTPATISDEIDLQELAVKGIVYFKRHFLFIAFSTIVGIILSIVSYNYLPKVFESRMSVMSDILSESYSKEISESLKNLIKEGNVGGLASRLSLSELEARGLNTIEIESIKKEKILDEEFERTMFIVTANISNKEILPKLQNGIVEFLRSNEFVKIRVRLRKEKYKSLIEKISLEIRSLDSLKRRIFPGLLAYSKNTEMLLLDPSNISLNIVELNKEKIRYENSLELADSIQLVEGFTVFEKPAQPKLSILLLIGFFGGLFAAIGLLTFIQLLKLANSKLR